MQDRENRLSRRGRRLCFYAQDVRFSRPPFSQFLDSDAKLVNRSTPLTRLMCCFRPRVMKTYKIKRLMEGWMFLLMMAPVHLDLCTKWAFATVNANH